MASPSSHSNAPPVADPRGQLFRHQNLSNTSIGSSVLLDHRDQQSMRPRRQSTQLGSATAFSGINQRSPLNSTLSAGASGSQNAGGLSAAAKQRTPRGMQRFSWNQDGNNDERDSDNENTPLMTASTRSLGRESSEGQVSPVFSGKPKRSRPSTADSGSMARRPAMVMPSNSGMGGYGSVNFPPSVPGSPSLDPHRPLLGIGAQTFANEHHLGLPSGHLGLPPRINDGDTVISISEDAANDHIYPDSTCQSPPHEMGPGHRKTTAEEDVCFPVDDGLTDDEVATIHGEVRTRVRRRLREWPDLSVLEEWSRDEKEERSEGIRAKKTSEPVYVGGRLRAPQRSGWHREVDDEPYRFTYFNDEIPATIHSHTISELLQPGQTFKDLFRPEPRVLDDSSDEEDDDMPSEAETNDGNGGHNESSTMRSPHNSTPAPPRVGPRPTFWLDVMNPTDAEMKVFIRAFGIHPLTAEDIMMQETREKVELFRSYYLVSYRTFEQDSNSEDYLDPVNLYFVVFREGVISFHFSLTPHPANVRRRIRQLKDYITVSADWISYALIDDITDAFAPLIQNLEEEVDDIDDAILLMHLSESSSGSDKRSSAGTQADDEVEQKSDGDMLKRVGDSRKKVMGLYRLLQNKADVIKGFAKRCNEQWEVAPRSEIGLYLGDIQGMRSCEFNVWLLGVFELIIWWE